jgi:hypothetical protein
MNRPDRSREMARAKVTVGTRIYYTGDMANPDDFGTVTQIIPGNKYSPELVEVTLDDGRIRKPYASMIEDTYAGSHTTRFVTLEAYDAWCKAAIEDMQRQYAHLLGK